MAAAYAFHLAGSQALRAAEAGEFDRYRNAALILRFTETSAEARRQAISWFEAGLAKGDIASVSELGAI